MVLWVMVGLLCLDFVVERVLEWLNMRAMSPVLPERLRGIYDEGEYARFQGYKRACGRLEWWESVAGFAVMLGILCGGVFGWWDGVVAGWTEGMDVAGGTVVRTLLFLAGLGLAVEVAGLPFEWYGTFGIEARYGFNKMSVGTFFGDKLKGLAVTGVLGGVLLGAVVRLWLWLGADFWLYAWGVLTAVSLVMGMFYSQLIVPLFNKQVPLEEGSLREKIGAFARKAGFRLDNIYVIDGSRRTTKANAYFTGLGTKKRVVLYDTLLRELTEEEVVAVLAHEVGHYKRRHTVWMMGASVLQTGFMLWVFSLAMGRPELSEALGGEGVSFGLGLVAFGLLYSPVSMVAGLAMNVWSRRCEYEADAFAAKWYDGEALASGLKKISVKALGNLTPHPVYEWVYYSHPGLLKRLEALKKVTIGDGK